LTRTTVFPSQVYKVVFSDTALHQTGAKIPAVMG